MHYDPDASAFVCFRLPPFFSSVFLLADLVTTKDIPVFTIYVRPFKNGEGGGSQNKQNRSLHFQLLLLKYPQCKSAASGDPLHHRFWLVLVF